MHVIVTQEDLLQSLNIVSGFVAQKSQLPILSNILLTTDQNSLTLSATNLELSIKHTIPAKVEKEGSITVPARELTESVSYLSPGKITLSLTETNLLNLDAEKYSGAFATQLPDDYPPFPFVDQSQLLNLSFTDLSKYLELVTPSASTEENRPILTAILWKQTSDSICLTATDGFRLSTITRPLTVKLPSSFQDLSLLVPAKTFLELNKLAKGQKDIKVFLSPEQSQITFLLENNLSLSSRLLQGDYPPYQRIIPTASQTKITLDKEELTQAVKSTSVFARQSANVIKLKIGTATVELSANAPQVGKNKRDVDIRLEGKPLEIAFNYKFILDFLSICSSDTVVVELNEPLTPGIFKDLNNPDLIHVIMPFRLQD